MENDQLQPWMRGPFELLRHANGHLKNPTDTDRRIALIGFDNAIEVSIDVFLNLHPRLRKGLEITKEEKVKDLSNYHSKIEFLDRYVQNKEVDLSIPIEAIVWYHELRNELYHSGNGMVPEMHAIEGAHNAALAVFQAIFEIDVRILLGERPVKSDSRDVYIPSFKVNDEMEFLRIFIDFEKSLVDYASVNAINVSGRRLPVRDLWKEYATRNKLQNTSTKTVEEAIKYRNYIAHGEVNHVNEVARLNAFVELSELTEIIRKSTLR